MSDRPDLHKLVEECDDETKLAVTAWVFRHILAHARERGSFRGSTYVGLRFGVDPYTPLCMADDLEISNEFDIERLRKFVRIVQEQKIEALKRCWIFVTSPTALEKRCAGGLQKKAIAEPAATIRIYSAERS